MPRQKFEMVVVSRQRVVVLGAREVPRQSFVMVVVSRQWVLVCQALEQ